MVETKINYVKNNYKILKYFKEVFLLIKWNLFISYFKNGRIYNLNCLYIKFNQL